MPTPITIRERIERHLVMVIEDIDGMGTVHRWTTDGLNSLTDGDALVLLGDERVEEGGHGNPGLSTRELTVEVLALPAFAETDSQPAAQKVNHWLGLLEHALMADPLLTETSTGGERLAVDSRVAGIEVTPFEEGQERLAAIVSLLITYQTYRDDPYTGPGITERNDP